MEALALLAGGVAAGTLGGLLGIGGGIILMPLLRFGVGLSPGLSAGTCVLAVFFTTAGGSYRHYRLGHIEPRSVAPIIVAGLVTSAVTSLLFGAIAHHGRLLDFGIGAVFFVIAARMLHGSMQSARSRPRAPEGEPHAVRVPGSTIRKAWVGAAGGAFPGLLGIGTGGVLVPAITFLLRAPIKTAMAASLCCFACTAFVSAAFKSAQGYVAWAVAVPICAGTLLGSNLGALLHHRFSARLVAGLFGLLFLYVALRYLLVATC